MSLPDELEIFLNEFDYLRILYREEDSTYFLEELSKFSSEYFPWLFRRAGVAFPIEIDCEGITGIIGFGLNGEEIYREIPSNPGWEYRYLNALIFNPRFISWEREQRVNIKISSPLQSLTYDEDF